MPAYIQPSSGFLPHHQVLYTIISIPSFAKQSMSHLSSFRPSIQLLSKPSCILPVPIEGRK